MGRGGGELGRTQVGSFWFPSRLEEKVSPDDYQHPGFSVQQESDGAAHSLAWGEILSWSSIVSLFSFCSVGVKL